MVRMRRDDGTFPVIPPAMDFRKLSRSEKEILTTVTLFTDYERTEWIKLGEISFRESGNRDASGVWSLGAYLANATDFEHDSAHLLKMELVGVQLTAVKYGQTRFVGFIRADYEDGFRVPGPDYNPLTHKDAKVCKGTKKDYCKWADNKPHMIVPEGFYVPPANAELFNIVRGRRVEVVTGPIQKEADAEE